MLLLRGTTEIATESLLHNDMSVSSLISGTIICLIRITAEIRDHLLKR